MHLFCQNRNTLLLWNFLEFWYYFGRSYFLMINQKVRGSRIENQHNSTKFGTILARFIENPENPEESWKGFSGFFAGKYQCIYMYLLYIIIIIIIIIPILAFSWKTERPLLKMWKTKYFLFWGGPPLQVFRILPKSGLNHWYHYRINLKSELRITQDFQDFYQEKKT